MSFPTWSIVFQLGTCDSVRVSDKVAASQLANSVSNVNAVWTECVASDVEFMTFHLKLNVPNLARQILKKVNNNNPDL